jgi:hypothetical protein
LSILCEEATEEMKPHYVNVLKIFKPILENPANIKSLFYALSSLKNMIRYISSDEMVR